MFVPPGSKPAKWRTTRAPTPLSTWPAIADALRRAREDATALTAALDSAHEAASPSRPPRPSDETGELVRAGHRCLPSLRRRRVARDVTSAAFGAALRGLPWVLRERRPMPPAVEAWIQLLDAPDGLRPTAAASADVCAGWRG